MDFEGVKSEVWRLVEPVAAAEGLELVEVELRHGGGRSILTIYLDRQGGISLDELTAMSRQLSDLLDVHEVMSRRYVLEVSSPGLNRLLTRPEHFQRVVGGRVRLKTREPVGGRSSFVGLLKATSDSGVTIQADGEVGTREIPYGMIKRANFEYDFGSKPIGGGGERVAGKRPLRPAKEG